jgi:hypothetical protein
MLGQQAQSPVARIFDGDGPFRPAEHLQQRHGFRQALAQRLDVEGRIASRVQHGVQIGPGAAAAEVSDQGEQVGDALGGTDEAGGRLVCQVLGHGRQGSIDAPAIGAVAVDPRPDGTPEKSRETIADHTIGGVGATIK